MSDERQVRPGFLPPRAPGGAEPPVFQPPAPAAPDPPAPPQPPASTGRPVFVAQRMESGPRSPLALAGTIVGAISLVLLLLTIGFAYPFALVLSSAAVLCGVLARQQIRERGVGRAGQARAAIWVGAVGLLLALAAWITIEATGFTIEELQRWLEDLERQLEEERQRTRPREGGREDVPA